MGSLRVETKWRRGLLNWPEATRWNCSCTNVESVTAISLQRKHMMLIFLSNWLSLICMTWTSSSYIYLFFWNHTNYFYFMSLCKLQKAKETMWQFSFHVLDLITKLSHIAFNLLINCIQIFVYIFSLFPIQMFENR